MLDEYPPIMTAEEVAELLRLNTRTITKLASGGGIPYLKVANQYRFSREKIMHWIENGMKQGSDDVQPEIALSLEKLPILIHRIASPKHFLPDLPASTRTEAIAALVNAGAELGLIKDKKRFQQLVELREQQHTTALGRGIAIPHPRSADFTLISRMVLMLGISKKGIEFDAIDQKPVRIIIMVASPVLSIHLKLISHVSRMFDEERFIHTIAAQESSMDIMNLIKEKEKVLFEL
jgi:PTS system nitrogen regulatory IIA component